MVTRCSSRTAATRRCSKRALDALRVAPAPGRRSAPAMTAVFDELGLVEEVTLARLSSPSIPTIDFDGYLAVVPDEDRRARRRRARRGSTRAGLLDAAVFAAASLGTMPRLIARKQRKPRPADMAALAPRSVETRGRSAAARRCWEAVVAEERPVLFKGAAADWPLVQRRAVLGRGGRRDAGRRAGPASRWWSIAARPRSAGRFAYNARGRRLQLRRLARTARRGARAKSSRCAPSPDAPSIYVGSTDLGIYFPGLGDAIGARPRGDPSDARPSTPGWPRSGSATAPPRPATTTTPTTSPSARSGGGASRCSRPSRRRTSTRARSSRRPAGRWSRWSTSPRPISRAHPRFAERARSGASGRDGAGRRARLPGDVVAPRRGARRVQRAGQLLVERGARLRRQPAGHPAPRAALAARPACRREAPRGRRCSTTTCSARPRPRARTCPRISTARSPRSTKPSRAGCARPCTRKLQR